MSKIQQMRQGYQFFLSKLFDKPKVFLLLKRLTWISLLGIGALLYFRYLPGMGVDFTLIYPAGRAVLIGQNPYKAALGFYNPLWFLIIITPLSLLPLTTARLIWLISGFCIYIFSLRRMKLDKWSILLIMLSPFPYYDLGIGNYEWLILFGATLPIQYGIWFLSLKPQITLILITLRLRQQKKWTRVFFIIFPVALITGLSILFNLYQIPNRSKMYWSADVWPYGIPFGLVLAYLAFKQDNDFLALAASPFLSPYVAIQSWIVVLLPVARKRWILMLGVIASWILVLIRMNAV